jgi:hypothetical protein
VAGLRCLVYGNVEKEGAVALVRTIHDILTTEEVGGGGEGEGGGVGGGGGGGGVLADADPAYAKGQQALVPPPASTTELRTPARNPEEMNSALLLSSLVSPGIQ